MSFQEGIHFAKSNRKPAHLQAVFLNFPADMSRQDAGAALQTLWDILVGLQDGNHPDIPVKMQDHGRLCLLIGFGPRLFDRSLHVQQWVPDFQPGALSFVRLGQLEGPFRSLKWAEDADRDAADSDVVIQLTGASSFIVHLAVAEVALAAASRGLEISYVADGFDRPDRRSWLGFHDGISNLNDRHNGSKPFYDRRRAMRVLPGQGPAWLVQGTYMAFMKIALDLSVWRSHPLSSREAWVGRTLEDGTPVHVRAAGAGYAVEKMDVGGLPTVGLPNNQSFLPPTKFGHVHRANLGRKPVGGDGAGYALRIFRQGYEFAEWDASRGRFLLGLNFVSYQLSPGIVTQILTLPNWLGSVQFGGTADELKFLSVLAAGYFAVPPAADGRALPGAVLFG